MIDLLWVAAGLSAIGLALPAKPHVRVVAILAVLLVILAVFQTTGGRGSFGMTATYVIVFAIAVTALFSFKSDNTPWLFFPLLAYLGFGYFFVWDNIGGLTGGTMNLIFAVAAWTAGLFMGKLYRQAPQAEHGLVAVIFAIVVFELAVCILQELGMGLFEVTGRTAELEGGRASGTYGHPSTLGKILTLTAVLLLPGTKSQVKRTRVLATSGLLLSALAVAITLSRANMVAIGSMILLWALLQRGEKVLSRRFALPALMGVAALFFMDTLLERFQGSGGLRDHFMEAASAQVARTPWTGVGPARYIYVVGQYDPVTAGGWPVHNVFMLTTVELGIVGASLFFLPVIVVFIKAIKKFRSSGREGDYSRALVAYIPAFVAIGWTGWGLLAPSVLGFAFFILAFAYTQMIGPHPVETTKDVRKTVYPLHRQGVRRRV